MESLTIEDSLWRSYANMRKHMIPIWVARKSPPEDIPSLRENLYQNSGTNINVDDVEGVVSSDQRTGDATVNSSNSVDVANDGRGESEGEVSSSIEPQQPQRQPPPQQQPQQPQPQQQQEAQKSSPFPSFIEKIFYSVAEVWYCIMSYLLNT